MEVAGEATCHPHPSRQVGGRAGHGGSPGDRHLGAEPRHAGLLAEGDEAGQQLALADELVAERPAQAEIVLAVTAQLVHGRAPGQGRTTADSASWSTLA